MKREKLVGALNGLAKACDRVPADEQVNQVMVEALQELDTCSDGEEQQFIEMLHKEKHRLLPDCTVCQSPCGFANDYDFYAYHQAPEEEQQKMDEILEEAIRLSRLPKIQEAEEEMALIRKGMFYIGLNMSLDTLQMLSDEMRVVGKGKRPNTN